MNIISIWKNYDNITETIKEKLTTNSFFYIFGSRYKDVIQIRYIYNQSKYQRFVFYNHSITKNFEYVIYNKSTNRRIGDGIISNKEICEIFKKILIYPNKTI